MELQQIRYVLAVVDHGTFTAAAAACHVAQPSLSHAIKTLERELGVALFVRVGRGVVLSSAGEAFVVHGRATLRAVESIRSEVGAVSGALAGHLDIVALPTLAVEPVIPSIGAFRAAHPGVTVRLAQPEGTGELLRMVRAGESEVGITEMPAAHDGLSARSLGRQQLMAVQPPGSARRRALPIGELGRLPLVTQRRGTSTRDLLDAALDGVQPVIAVETDQRDVLVPLVLAGAGVSVLPAPMAAVAQAQGAVVAPLRPALWREIAVVTRDGPPSPAARAFLPLIERRRP